MATDKNETSDAAKVEASEAPENNQPSKKYFVMPLVTLLSIVAVLGIVALFVKHNNDNNKAAELAAHCTNDIIKKANFVIEYQDSAKLKTIAKEVRQLKSHDTDVNCLYILTSADVTLSDQKNAHTDYQKLDSAIKTTKLSPLLTVAKDVTLSDLKSSIDRMDLLYKHAIQNGRGF